MKFDLQATGDDIYCSASYVPTFGSSPFDSSGQYKTSPGAFLFRLVNINGLGAKRYEFNHHVMISIVIPAMVQPLEVVMIC
ncbi:hypothetical protein P9112_009249 [Eukaryota sp. TZLM1-RC]